MNILIAPDKFKHSLQSHAVCVAIKSGLLRISKDFTITLLPLADGGDGLLEIIEHYLSVKKHSLTVWNPLFQQIDSHLLLSQDGKTAYVEMAKASGLQLLDTNEYNCMKTTSFGTGELIKAASDLGATKIVIGIGGSATNDCGIGMAAALGHQFLDKHNNLVIPIGENLGIIEKVDSSNAVDLSNVEIEIACDVKNPLIGPNGATKVFAKQKGASEKDIELLEAGMRHFSEIMKREFNKDLRFMKGAGAAGGMGAGAMAFLNAKLIGGIELVLSISEAETYVKNADLIISGEGKIDSQSMHGKVLSGIGNLCKNYNKPLILFCGSSELSLEELQSIPVKAVYAILKKDITVEESQKRAAELLADAAYTAGKELLKTT